VKKIRHKPIVRISIAHLNSKGNDPNTIPEQIETKGVFLSTKNPVVKLGMILK